MIQKELDIMVRNLFRVLFGVCLASSMTSVLALNIEMSNVSGTKKASCQYAAVNFANNGAIKVTCSDDVTCTGCGGAQTISFGAAPNVAVNGTGTVSATASSTFPVTFSSITPTICTIAGNSTPSPITVNGIATGTCTIAANQAGNASYSPATQQTQSFAISSGGTSTNCPNVPTLAQSGELGDPNFSGTFNVNAIAGDYAVVAIKFHLSQTSGSGSFNFVDTTGSGSFRDMTVALSACPGDFTGIGVIQGTFNGGYCIRSNAMNYAVSTGQTKYCSVLPGQSQYYLNVKTTNPGQDYRFLLQYTWPQ
jgi:hypothetical protein